MGNIYKISQLAGDLAPTCRSCMTNSRSQIICSVLLLIAGSMYVTIVLYIRSKLGLQAARLKIVQALFGGFAFGSIFSDFNNIVIHILSISHMETLSCIQQTTCKLLSSGQIPAHIGFIMDGNRRHAKKNKYQSTHQGHIEGVRSLKKCLLMCKHIGIKQISLFAFSVQNFNRSEQEVEGLMSLCMKTFDEMSPMAEMLLKNGIKVRIVGRRDMLRQDVRNALEKIQTKTKDFEQIVVNLCFAYDSIHEVQTSISNMKSTSYSELINNLAIPSHLDILVRTANEYRLSNFMLPQTAYAYICILKQNWPQINLWSFCKIMLAYNYHYKDIMRNKKMVMEKMKLTLRKASQSTQKVLKQEPNQESLDGENQQLIKEQ